MYSDITLCIFLKNCKPPLFRDFNTLTLVDPHRRRGWGEICPSLVITYVGRGDVNKKLSPDWLYIYQASLSLCKRLIAAFTHWIRVWFLIKEKDKVRVCRHRVWEGISELLDQFMYFWSKHVNDEIRNR